MRIILQAVREAPQRVNDYSSLVWMRPAPSPSARAKIAVDQKAKFTGRELTFFIQLLRFAHEPLFRFHGVGERAGARQIESLVRLCVGANNDRGGQQLRQVIMQRVSNFSTHQASNSISVLKHKELRMRQTCLLK